MFFDSRNDFPDTLWVIRIIVPESNGEMAVIEGEEETMEVTVIFKIAAVGILVSVLCQILKHSGRDEQAFLVSLAGLLMVLFWIVPYIYELFESIQKMFVL